ncbi:hypothetical protein, partial [Escherichia coli]|uniref:hypothetical protein n=1 Tax=Escherichia coli TaxID=562 RepID=UPI001FF64579
CESANYIGARSFMAAKKPDIKLQPTVNVGTMDALQTGCVHITQYDEIRRTISGSRVDATSVAVALQYRW